MKKQRYRREYRFADIAVAFWNTFWSFRENLEGGDHQNRNVLYDTRSLKRLIPTRDNSAKITFIQSLESADLSILSTIEQDKLLVRCLSLITVISWEFLIPFELG